MYVCPQCKIACLELYFRPPWHHFFDPSLGLTQQKVNMKHRGCFFGVPTFMSKYRHKMGFFGLS